MPNPENEMFVQNNQPYVIPKGMIMVPTKSLLNVIRKIDFDAPIPSATFEDSFDDLRKAFTPDEIASGEIT